MTLEERAFRLLMELEDWRGVISTIEEYRNLETPDTAAILDALREVRAEALEEAAAVCDDEFEPNIAARIRGLKDAP